MPLELRRLEKRFGTVHAVQPLDLEIRRGEFFSLLGPSGCGKTTLLRMLGGFEEPSGGAILLEGSRIDKLSPERRPFNMVFQRYALFPHLSVARNVAFGLEVKRVAAGETRSRVSEALELVRMDSMADRGVATLSGGQQQRVALARALVNRPRVLLLDEPLSALDLKLRQQMQVELLSLQRRLGHTFVFVTHDQEEALTLSDRIAVMNGGVVEQVGTPREIYDRPSTPFVARFIGSINDIDGILVRPEKLRLLKAAPKPGDGLVAIEGVVHEILFQGPVTQFVVRRARGSKPESSDRPPVIVSQPSAGAAPKIGESVFVAWAADDGMVMGAETRP